MKIIILGTNLNSDNRGVQALGYGAIDILTDLFPGQTIQFVNLFISPGNTSKISEHVTQIRVRKIDFILLALAKLGLICNTPIANHLRTANYIFSINEGDGYSDIYGARRFLSTVAFNFICSLFSDQFYFLPQTIGPFTAPYLKAIALRFLRTPKKIFVRDKISQKFLVKNNLKATVIPDMAISMKPVEVKSDLPHKFVAINVSGLLFFGSQHQQMVDQVSYRETILYLIHYLLSKGENVVLVPHVYHSLSVSSTDDLRACYLCYSCFKKHSNLKIITQPYTAPELKYLIAKSKLMISSRMHACIAALSTSRPAIALAYSYKFKGTFSNFDMKSWVMELYKRKYQQPILRSTIDLALTQLPKVSTDLTAKMFEIKKQIKEQFTL